MRYTYDKEHRLLYVYLVAGRQAEDQAELVDGSVVDLDSNGEVIGIEVLNVADWRPELFAKEFDLPDVIGEALQGLRSQLLALDIALVVA